MDEKLKTAILRTLAYSDIFNYPLRVSELHKYLIGLRVDKPSVFSSLFNTGGRGPARGGFGNTRVGERNGYFFLPGKERIVALRQHREKILQEKIEKAKKVLHVLKHIPFVKMVAVTGAVAAGNANENSDIDVLVVAQKNRLWSVRFTAIFLLELKGIRRRPPSPKLQGIAPARFNQDKICLNMFISEENLELPNKDLFTANEFVRMKVVWEKDNVYERFVKANGWVKAFLRNWQTTIKTQNSKLKTQNHNLNLKSRIQQNPQLFRILNLGFRYCFVRQLADRISDFGFNSLEKIVRAVQLKYMRKRKTTETVTNGLLMFHPHDAREWVMRGYNKRLEELEISH